MTKLNVLDEDPEKDDELEIVDMWPLISVPQEGGVEKIINLKEWMKSPFIGIGNILLVLYKLHNIKREL